MEAQLKPCAMAGRALGRKEPSKGTQQEKLGLNTLGASGAEGSRGGPLSPGAAPVRKGPGAF